MTCKRRAGILAAMHAFAAAAVLGTPAPALASSCSCTMKSQRTCIDATSSGPNEICQTKKCPARATFSIAACPTEDLVATCSLKGPGYTTHNRYYAPLWKLETLKGMCAGMKGEFSPATR